MVAKKKTTTRKYNAKEDEIAGRQRYVDQPGQWRNVTPPEVRKKQAKAWKELEESLHPTRKKASGTKSRKK